MGTRIVGSLVIVCACGGKTMAIPSPPPPPPDGGTTLDAAGDLGTDPAPSDGGGEGWCSAHFPYATLCDDFDLATVPRPEWNVLGTGMTVIASAFASSPHALEVTSPSTLTFDVVDPPYGAKLEADVEVDADGASGASLFVASITAQNGPSVAFAAVPGTSLGRCAIATTASAPTFTDFPLTRGAPHSVSLKISFNSSGTINLICDVDATDHGAHDLAGTQNLGQVSLTVGASDTTTGPVDVKLDDVVIEI